ncbi:MAG TPA: TlyA family RNA methyltransferase [Microbacteriaceae bacterium]|nr:TlyA family RNA methyltransferase [Microbacteriaceae bacterium]
MTGPPDGGEAGRKRRLDVAVASRGLARSRTHAARLIALGNVTVEGETVTRPAFPVVPSARIVVRRDHYVGRGAVKLVAALDAFGLAVAGRQALDAGASTGGFSQVLLERGASVVAVDVGHGQLAPELVDHPRLRAYDGVNVRSIDAEAYGRLTGGARRPDLVVADLSFISLTQVIPALVATAAREADFVLLVKPQFEVGRRGVPAGVVRSARLREGAVNGVVAALFRAGLGVAGIIPSPITGEKGNREYLVHATRRCRADPTEWEGRIRDMVGGR